MLKAINNWATLGVFTHTEGYRRWSLIIFKLLNENIRSRTAKLVQGTCRRHFVICILKKKWRVWSEPILVRWPSWTGWPWIYIFCCLPSIDPTSNATKSSSKRTPFLRTLWARKPKILISFSDHFRLSSMQSGRKLKCTDSTRRNVSSWWNPKK